MTTAIRRHLLGALALSAIAFAATCVATWETGCGPALYSVRAALHDALATRTYQRAIARDPAVGSRLPAAEHLRDVSGDHATCIVLFVPAPTPCCAQDRWAWVRSVAQALKEAGLQDSIKVIVVVPEKRVAPDGRDREAPSYQCVLDPDGRVARAYNAFFRPRAYVLRDGCMIWKQDRMEMTPSEIADAARRCPADPSTPR